MTYRNPPDWWERPERFDEIMDRVRRGEKIDWDHEDVPKR
jgi:hypothetical protein